MLADPLRAQSNHTDEALHFLKLAVAEDLLDVANFELAGLENIKQTSDDFLALGITPGQRRVNGGMRAEISVNYPFSPGDLVEYPWRFRLPPDFQSDAPDNRWMLIGQWHDQPNKSLGETWETFESSSPPLSLALGELDGNVGVVVVYGETISGKPTKVSAPVFLQRGRWNEVAITVLWSQQDDGYVDFRINEQQGERLEGANMNNGATHYFKAGIYRHPDISGEAWIHLDEIAFAHR